MKKQYLILLLALQVCFSLEAQRIIQATSGQFTILQLHVVPGHVSCFDPVSSKDSPEIQLFKKYFNAGSFEAYRNYFLSADWGGFKEPEFVAWQTYLRTNTMKLEKTVHLRDQSGKEYVICQYTVDTDQYRLPGTAIFKKVNQAWKHISFMNDEEADDLKQIGLLQTSYIEALPGDGLPKPLQNMVSNIDLPAEKFNRSTLFQKIKLSLEAKGVSASDLHIAESLFNEKAEVEMVQFISRDYKLDSYDLMEELNGIIGFTMFKFARTLNTN